MENRENQIKIGCENPIMLSSLSEKIENHKQEFAGNSFSFYTGCREEIVQFLNEGNCDIVLLLGEMMVENYRYNIKKLSSFIPSSVYEPLTGIPIEPIENQSAVMYILWNEKYMTETKRKLISYI